MISCRELSKRFGAITAVNSLSLEVARGTICAFLGPNGAGKSTTVKMLSGLLAPTSGQASVCGFDVATHRLEVKRHIGVLPESLGLFNNLTIEKHLLRSSGKHYVTQGTAAVGRTLPPGTIPDTLTVSLPFAVFPPSAVPDIVEDYPPTDYPLIVKVIALVIAAVIG